MEINRKAEKFVRMKGFEELYVISNYGRVISLCGKRPRELRQLRTYNGYLVVFLRGHANKVKRRVNRLVGLHFLPDGDASGLAEIHHRDADRDNNYFENLVWCSHLENVGWRH